MRAWLAAALLALPVPPALAAAPETVCLDEIRDAERTLRLPHRLLLAIGVTEAGRTADGRITVWPWTVNAEGRGRFFPDKASAIRHVEALRARGVRSVDVGCLQVNLHWHADAFPDLETAFDPAANVAYGAGLLKRLQGDLRSWSRAAKTYHSATRDRGEAYYDRLMQNLRLVTRRRRDLADAPVLGMPSARTPAHRQVADQGKDDPPGAIGGWKLPLRN